MEKHNSLIEFRTLDMSILICVDSSITLVVHSYIASLNLQGAVTFKLWASCIKVELSKRLYNKKTP